MSDLNKADTIVDIAGRLMEALHDLQGHTFDVLGEETTYHHISEAYEAGRKAERNYLRKQELIAKGVLSE